MVLLLRICTRLNLFQKQVYTSDAKDQGVCSACSAFSTVAALETCVQRFAFSLLGGRRKSQLIMLLLLLITVSKSLFM